MVGPYSTVSQSILLDLLLWLEDKAAQRHKSNGMFSTIVPVLCLTDEGRSKQHSSITNRHTLYMYTDGATMHTMNY